MPNFVKRIEKFADNKLHSGEQILATGFFQQKGSLSAATTQSMLGLIGALLNHFKSKNEKQKKESTSTPLTKKLPDGTLLMAITDKRILVYKHKELGAKIESLVAEYHKGDIIKVDLKSYLIMTVVTLHFKDGGSVKLEAVMGQNLKKFAELVVKHN